MPKVEAFFPQPAFPPSVFLPSGHLGLPLSHPPLQGLYSMSLKVFISVTLPPPAQGHCLPQLLSGLLPSPPLSPSLPHGTETGPLSQSYPHAIIMKSICINSGPQHVSTPNPHFH